MLKRHALAIAAGAVLALCACGDGSSADELAGMYQVTSHTRNDTACDAEGPDVADPPYFRLSVEDFLGETLLELAECTSSDPASCTGGGLFSSFIYIGGAWQNEISSSSGGGATPCSLAWVKVALEPTETGVRIVTNNYGETDDTLSEDECDPDEAQARGADMPCTSYEVLAGDVQ